MTNSLCGKLSAWHDKYPVPSATTEQNAEARRAEDEWLSSFTGLVALDRDQAERLVRWKFQSMAHRRALAIRGISRQRWEPGDGTPGAAYLIRRALMAEDDYEAIAIMARRIGGIAYFGPAMSSVILAVCRPATFTVADTRALKALRGLGFMDAGPEQFRLVDWLPYLAACRSLAEQCNMTLRQVDRALWVAAAEPDVGAGT